MAGRAPRVADEGIEQAPRVGRRGRALRAAPNAVLDDPALDLRSGGM